MATVGDIMSRDLVTVLPTTTVAEAATAMGERQVGSALVLAGDALLGIFTERDALRALASDFDAARHEVQQWMTREPQVVDPDTDANRALETMLSRRFRHLPVVAEGRVVGIVSLRDLTRV